MTEVYLPKFKRWKPSSKYKGICVKVPEKGNEYSWWHPIDQEVVFNFTFEKEGLGNIVLDKNTNERKCEEALSRPFLAKAMTYLVIPGKGAYHRNIMVPHRFNVIPWFMWEIPCNGAMDSIEFHKSGKIKELKNKKLNSFFKQAYGAFEIDNNLVQDLIKSENQLLSDGFYEQNIKKYQENLEKIIRNLQGSRKHKWMDLILNTYPPNKRFW